MRESRSRKGALFARVIRALHRETQRVVVGVVGALIVLTGVVLLPLPGPGMLVVLAGLAVLATQFRWAQDLLDRLREQARAVLDRLRGEADDGSAQEEVPQVHGSHRDRSPHDRGSLGDRSDVA